MNLAHLETTEAAARITQRIVERFHPLRVILFGSRARGEAHSESDFDLLIVAPSDKPRWQRTVPVYRALAGLGVPKDIVWWTPEEIAEWEGVKSHFINTAIREGRVLYENANSHRTLMSPNPIDNCQLSTPLDDSSNRKIRCEENLIQRGQCNPQPLITEY